MQQNLQSSITSTNTAITSLNQQIQNDTITVTQLNKLAKTLLENNMPICWISGEISSVKKYSHIYFDLKDETAKISCVLFAGNLNNIDFNLENGLKVELRGRITIYQTNGSYQINVERIRKLGIGGLWEAYHKLMNKLKLEGIFDAKHKKPIPLYPRSIGVITSKEGSVIRDVITTLKRRMPNIPVIIYHSAVQGTDASMQIAKAIRTANARGDVDVLIICRGGGSLEDLWCFNEEIVAREVFTSQIPIISAVGHETDTTIIDFVSDLRAPTPTAAAEMVAKSRDEWGMLVHKLHHQLVDKFTYVMNNKTQALDSYLRQLKLLNPINQLKNKHLKVSHLNNILNNKILEVINIYTNKLKTLNIHLNNAKPNIVNYTNKLENIKYKLHANYKNCINVHQTHLNTITVKLDLVNPYGILNRGYAIIKNKDGNIVTKGASLKHNEEIMINFKDDVVHATVNPLSFPT